jgi:hypothetical protein
MDALLDGKTLLAQESRFLSRFRFASEAMNGSE